MDNLEFIFSQLKLFELKYKKIEEASIDSFNIFSILRNSTDEVNLHSKFIYELLNPNGSHRQGNLFLKLFIEEIEIDFPYFGATLSKEKFKIDILIESNRKVIILENKIETQDHSNQLSSYLNRVKEIGYRDENIYLIYLTLFGEEPREEKIRERVINISYSENIKNWIESCIKEVALLPTLRESLVQYLSLINRLTNQSQHKGFILEVKEFLLQNDNLKTILNIEKATIEAKIEIQLRFWRELIENLKEYPFQFYSENDYSIEESVAKYYKKHKNKRYYGYKYEIDDNLCFYIEIEHNIYYGFYFYDEDIDNRELEKLDRIKANWEEKYWKYPNKRLNFEEFNTQNVLDLIDDKKRREDIKKISDEIIDIIEEYKKEEI